MASKSAEDNEAVPASLTTQQPSFEGRLKLTEFMYTNPASASTSPRRSSRLDTPGSTVSPAPGKKRKSTKQSTPSTTPSPKKRSRGPGNYAPPSTYAHLPLLPDALAPDLLILFIGLNPGVQTARSGHAYAHPSNLFWKLLYSSRITPVLCKAEEDQTMPARYALGNTNIVARPSRNGAELSKAEMDAGVAILEEKVARWRPEVVCVVGKSIWESIFRVRKGRAIRKEEFKYGWQNQGENMGVGSPGGREDAEFKGARVFVASSTSGLAATLRPEEKERIWKELGDWCVKRRKEREEEARESSRDSI